MSDIGPNDPGNDFGAGGWTGQNGWYLRTPANKFPGKPHQEGPGGFGFEGSYPENVTDFTVGGVSPAGGAPSNPATCPFTPDAVVITTQSPVEIIATSSSGKQVRTKDGAIVAQELDSGIHSMAFPHDDGTFAWTLVLPPDDYDVKLVGTRAGPYTLTLTTFDADGNPVDKVTEGFTNPDQIDEYKLEAPEPVAVVTPPPAPVPPAPSGNGSANGAAKAGGGGALDAWLLLALSVLAAATAIRASRGRRSSASVRW